VLVLLHRRVDSQHLLLKELGQQEQMLLHRLQEMAESQSWRENPQLLTPQFPLSNPQATLHLLAPGRPSGMPTPQD
jgi:hypothetical protein